MIGQKTTPPAAITPFTYADGVSDLNLSKAPIVAQYLAAGVMAGIATIVALALDSKVTIPNLSLVYVVPVVIAAVVFGFGTSLCAAVLGALAYNFFFTEPRYTLIVDDPANIWAIALLFVVGCIASAVASTARRRADEAARLRQQTEVLRAYGRDVFAAGDPAEIAAVAASALQQLFHVPAVAMLISEASVDHVEKRGGIELSDTETEAARACWAERRTVHAGVYPFETCRFDFWPVASSAGQGAAIGLAFDPEEPPSMPGTLVETVASILALTLDRHHLRHGDGAEGPR